MFLTKENLLTEFRQRLESAQEIDIATAWATSGSALVALEDTVRKWKKPKGQLRTVVGISGNVTDPEVLERLNEVGELRLVDNNGPMFHPKVYIFRGSGKSVAWVGSANFTRAGFESNEEAVFETEDLNSVIKWFDTRWNQCEELKPTDIDNYRKRREENPPSKEVMDVIGSLSMTTDKSLSSRPDNGKRLGSLNGRQPASPFPTKIRFRGESICDEWVERRGEAWRKMFVCIADWLVREGSMTKDDCPVEITGKGPGGKSFLCVATDRSQLPKRKLLPISSGMWVAVPQKPNWSAERAKQLLEKFDIDPSEVELLMSG